MKVCVIFQSSLLKWLPRLIKLLAIDVCHRPLVTDSRGAAVKRCCHCIHLCESDTVWRRRRLGQVPKTARTRQGTVDRLGSGE